jgi:DnaK suppressor protein
MAKIEDIMKHRLKKMLKEKKKELEKEIERTKQFFKNELAQGQSVATTTHLADCNYNSDIPICAHRIVKLEKCQEKLEEALERLKNGTYGICQMCEDQIPIARLKSTPFTDLCVPCKNIKNKSFR